MNIIKFPKRKIEPKVRDMMNLSNSIDMAFHSYLECGGTVRHAVGLMANRLGELIRASTRNLNECDRLPEAEELYGVATKVIEKKIYQD